VRGATCYAAKNAADEWHQIPTSRESAMSQIDPFQSLNLTTAVAGLAHKETMR
jgi:hypothetical protein